MDPKSVAAAVRFASLTGWRRGEVCALTWGMIDTDSNVLIIPGTHTKNGEPKPFPLSRFPQLSDLLAERAQVAAEVQRRTRRIVRHVFCRPTGEPIKRLRGAWKGAVTRSKAPPARFHDLRVYALHAMEMAGIPRSLALLMSGHKTESVYTRYAAIFLDSELEDAGAKLAEYHAQKFADRPKTVPIQTAAANR